jgi:hypothetical protein
LLACYINQLAEGSSILHRAEVEIELARREPCPLCRAWPGRSFSSGVAAVLAASSCASCMVVGPASPWLRLLLRPSGRAMVASSPRWQWPLRPHHLGEFVLPPAIHPLVLEFHLSMLLYIS